MQDKDGFDAARRRQEAVALDARDALAGESPATVFKLLGLRFYGADMMQNWNHWASRAQGIALRAPYYDRRLVDLLYRLPMRGKGKPELRRIAAGLMPRDMAYAGKLPQGIPVGHWFRGPLRDFLGDHLSPARLQSSGVFDPAAVGRLLAQHQAGAAEHEWRLWTILAVLTWQRVVQKGVPAAARTAFRRSASG
jgi:asparagine synthase (glutamine-hydrolysing)